MCAFIVVIIIVAGNLYPQAYSLSISQVPLAVLVYLLKVVQPTLSRHRVSFVTIAPHFSN